MAIKENIMNTNTITDFIKDEIQGKEVLTAVFTSFTFEPEFFETEIITTLFQSEKYYSQHPTIKRFQVKNELEKSKIDIEVFYDKNVFNSDEVPQMEYAHHAINHPDGAFHPKIMLVLYINDRDTKSLLLYAGSNNLSKAGWWDNIETGNYIIIDKKTSISSYTQKNIEKALSYLKGQRKFSYKSKAIESIEKFLKENVKTAHNNATYFYFQRYKKDTCTDLFKTYPFSQRPSVTHLEIISPFFSNDDKNNLHKKSFSESLIINMLLPKNPQGKVLCTSGYYEHCKKNDEITWSNFSYDISKTLGIDTKEDGKAIFRKLHAKIYHFYNEQNSWFFTGSFNFSYQAFNDNIEAGFLYKSEQKCQPLLVSNEIEPSFESELADIDNPFELEEKELLDIDFLFDWDIKTLFIKSKSLEIKEFSLTNSSSQTLADVRISEEGEAEVHPSSTLISYLEKNSYLYVRGQAILIQHVNWEYKPNNFPPMSISEILSIYSTLDLNANNEQKYIAHLLKELAKQGALYEGSTSELELKTKQFFSEYAEIFHSFRKLNEAMTEAVENDDTRILEYYFRMRQPDSFSSIIEKISDDKDLDIATKYIVILCIEEMYEDYGNYINDPLYKTLTTLKKSIKREIAEEDFLDWFEHEFKYKHTQVEVCDD